MKRFALLLVLICLALLAASYANRWTRPVPNEAEFKVHFIDVGQGDSILIDLGESEVLIDAGEESPGVVSYLRDHVQGALEVMVATHPHADHIGGLSDVLSAFEVEQVWHNGEASDSRTYSEFLGAVQAEHTQVHFGRRGDRISAGKLSLAVLNPKSLAGSTNNNSIVLSLSYGSIDFLFMGDAEKEAEASMLLAADMPVPEVEVLKVGHHGSRTASSPDFLALTSSEVAIYMAGNGNTYGHPHKETLDALRQIGAQVRGTDINGTIVVTTNGKSYKLSSQK